MIRRLFTKLLMRFLFKKRLKNVSNPFALPLTRQSKKFMKKAHDSLITDMLNPKNVDNSRHRAFWSNFNDK
jgi:hypothetical protein